MDVSEKGNLSKTNFSIQIKDFEKTVRSFKDIHYTKLNQKSQQTVRNNREISLFNSPQKSLSPLKIDRRKVIDQLMLQKQNLMHCLQVLKTSAVSAIEQKDEQIQRLKATNPNQQYQKIQFYENELERSKRIRWQLEEEREELHRQMCLERHHSACQLQEKEIIIEQLSRQLHRLQYQLCQIEQLHHMKDRKIRLLQQEINELSQQLETANFSQTIDAQKSKMDLDQTLKINPSASLTSTNPNNSYLSNTIHYQDPEKHLNQTIEELSRKHKEDIKDLILFYEKKIETLYEIIEQDLNLTQTKQEDKYQHRTLVRNNSMRNLNKDLQVSCLSNNAFENKANLQNGQEMNEFGLQTSRSKAIKHNLKNQISMFNFSDHTIQYRLITYEDLEQQPYNQEVPKYSMKKDKSYDTFVMSQCELITQRKKNIQQLKQHQHPTPWQKTYIFAAGLFSGVTLTSLIKLALKQS